VLKRNSMRFAAVLLAALAIFVTGRAQLWHPHPSIMIRCRLLPTGSRPTSK